VNTILLGREKEGREKETISFLLSEKNKIYAYRLCMRKVTNKKYYFTRRIILNFSKCILHH